MIKPLSILFTVELLERFSYYGLRSFMILFMVDTLRVEHAAVAEFYGWFSLVALCGPIIGGIVSDLAKTPVLFAIIGAASCAVGCAVAGISSDLRAVQYSLLCVAVGSGLFKPGIISALYRNSFPHKQRFDLVYSIFYLAINLGAFLGPTVCVLLIGMDSNPDYRIAMLMPAAGFVIVTVLLSVFYKPLTNNDLVFDRQSFILTGSTVAMMVLLFAASLIFWSAYELANIFVDPSSRAQHQTGIAIITIVSSLAIIPLNLIPGFRSGYKIAIGFGLAALVFVLLIFTGRAFTPLYGLMVAEMFVGPIIMSALLVNGSPRFSGTLVGGLSLMAFISNKLVSFIVSGPESFGGKLGTVITVLLVGLGAAIFAVERLRSREQLSV